MRQKWFVKEATRGNAGQSEGQSLVEYALIAVLVAVAMIAALLLAGPAVGNVFSNTVYNAVEQGSPPYSTLSAADIQKMAGDLAKLTPATFEFHTNTPAAPTCSSFPGVWQTHSPTTIPPTYETTGCVPTPIH